MADIGNLSSEQRSKLQDVYEEIGRILLSITPDHAQNVAFRGRTDRGASQGVAFWEDDAGKEHRVDLSTRERRLEQFEVIAAVEKLFALEPFASAPKLFNHFHVRIVGRSDFAIDFGYISKEQEWAGVYMKPVGALTKEEAEAAFISEESWLNRKRLHEGAITKAEFDEEEERISRAVDERLRARYEAGEVGK